MQCVTVRGKNCPLLFVADLCKNVNTGTNTCFQDLILFLFLFNSEIRGTGSCMPILISLGFRVMFMFAFGWVCYSHPPIPSVRVVGFFILLEVKVNIIPSMPTFYFLTPFQLWPCDRRLLAITPLCY